MRVTAACVLMLSAVACGGGESSGFDAAVDATDQRDGSTGEGGTGLDASAGDGAAGEDGGASDASTDAMMGDATMGDAGDDAAAPSCNLGEACCPGMTCTDSSVCQGQTCSCIVDIHGDLYLRTDGRIVQGNVRFIEEADTGMPLGGVTDIFDGQFHGCARRDDGTVWCWAKNTTGNGAGQLGNGSLGGATVPWHATQVLAGAATPLTGVKMLNEGSSRCYIASTTCAIKIDGTVWCWGEGANGVGGSGASIFTDGTYSNPYAAQIMADATTPLTGVDQISLGLRHACALRSGEVWCWGANVGGALGLGDEAARQYPTKVTLPGAVEPLAQKVGAGSDVSCALAAGHVYCWGSSGSGQVGIGDPMATSDGCINFCRLTPFEVLDTTDAALGDVVDINVAYLAVCAERTDHTLWCWGAGAQNRAAPLVPSGSSSPAANVALQTTCSSAGIDQAIRYLTRNDELRNANLVVDQVCGDTF